MVLDPTLCKIDRHCNTSSVFLTYAKQICRPLSPCRIQHKCRNRQSDRLQRCHRPLGLRYCPLNALLQQDSLPLRALLRLHPPLPNLAVFYRPTHTVSACQQRSLSPRLKNSFQPTPFEHCYQTAVPFLHICYIIYVAVIFNPVTDLYVV